MLLDRSAQVAVTRPSVCAACASATSRCKSRLPNQGTLCISVYFVLPTCDGNKLVPLSVP